MTTLRATLAGVGIEPGGVRVDLLTVEGLTRVCLPLDAAAQQALGPLLAVHAHRPGCPGHLDVGVGLLLRTVQTLTGSPPRLVVLPDADPPVRLRVPGADVALGPLDACCLLCSQQLAVAVDPAPT